MQKNILIILSVTGFLAGCTTISPEQQLAADKQSCNSYGFKQGTDAFSNCLMQLDFERRADRRVWESQNSFNNRPMVIYQPIY